MFDQRTGRDASMYSFECIPLSVFLYVSLLYCVHVKIILDACDCLWFPVFFYISCLASLKMVSSALVFMHNAIIQIYHGYFIVFKLFIVITCYVLYVRKIH